METALFPFCLERSTNVPKGELRGLFHKELLDSVLHYRKLVSVRSAVLKECMAVLEHAYGEEKAAVILKAKRKMAALKPINSIEDGMPKECMAAIAEYNARLQEEKEGKERCRECYIECLASNRQYLRRFVEGSEGVLRTLPLINKDFDCKLKKYLELPPEEHNAKIRKLDHQLIRLFTRAAMKTSPFGYLTSVCLFEFERTCQDKEDGGGLASICEINNYIVKAIYDYILGQRYFAEQVDYRLNAYRDYGDSYLFLSQRDYEKGKVYKTVDVTAGIKKSNTVSCMIEAFEKGNADKTLSFSDMVRLFTEAGVPRETAANLCYEKFVKTNIVTPDISIDDTKSNIFEDFYCKLGRLKDDDSHLLAEVISRVKCMEENVRLFTHAGWQERFAIIKRQDALLTETEKLVLREFTHNIIMYEDTIYQTPKKPVTQKYIAESGMADLQRYFKIFDQGVLTYLLFGEHFFKKYGNRQVEAGDLEVYKLFVEAASSLSEVWKDNFSEIAFETCDKIRRISKLKQDMYKYIAGLKQYRTPQDIKQFIDNEVASNRDLFDFAIDSATVFFQTDREGGMVVNKVYKGQLLFFSRFLKLFAETPEKLWAYCLRAFGKNPLEITESFGFNANVHLPLFKDRLVLNLTDRNDRTDQDISIDDCYFYYEEESKTVKLGTKRLGEVNGVYLGSLAYNLMPVCLRTINGMQPSTRFDSAYLNLWNAEKKDVLIADYIPRIQYGGITFIRAQYLLNSIYDISRPAEELYVEILRDFYEQELPLRFFIRPYINGGGFDFYNMGRTSLKPQYIDMSSPLLFQELLREMENKEQFILEEVYPDNKEDEYIYEYQIEQTLYA